MKRNISKIISIALCIVLLASMCITASAASLNGKGTKNNPYTVSTAAELDALAADVAKGESFNGKFIRLEEGFRVSSSFKAIGSKDKPFKGTFDGNGKTLSGFNMNCDYAAPFGYTVGAVISNLSVTGAFTATSYAAGIVAYATDTTIEKCISNTSVSATKYAGGIVGFATGGKITECSTTLNATISSGNEFCGGIAGWSSAEINSCENNAYTKGYKNVGGIAGVSKGSIISCTNAVLVEATNANLGGIAGLAEGEIKNTKNTGEISSSNAFTGKAGGIAGVATAAAIEECHSNGKITAKAGSFTGGIAGYATNGSIKNCLVTAAVSSSGENAGGIFGCARETVVSCCVVTSSVTAKNSTDAAIGAISTADISDCYYNSALESTAVRTNSASVKNTKGISGSSFTSAAALSALDFSKIWTINTVHASYPLLKAIPYHTLKITSSSEADCTNDGKVTGVCSICTETVVTVTPAYGHTLNVVSYEAPTCTKAGFRDSLCTTCTKTISEEIPATGHTDADRNLFCDVCEEDISVKQPEKAKNIFEKIADFFNSIIEWIRNLFTKK